SFLIITDSGGVQEEAPSLGKPILVMRDVTERMEGVEAGTAKLVGAKRVAIAETAKSLLNDLVKYKNMSALDNPYGKGSASSIIRSILTRKSTTPVSLNRNRPRA
ncbi:MAG: UDP-N-acetylglucosamine 2-epimerase, partial [Cyclobacteriaceae bacterium]|nr:UDP-N-acetylglucosamine 2-epimerase [Cyclobacteriaceae bacterium]